MKLWFLIFFLLFSSILYSQNKNQTGVATKEDISTILREMDKRFEQVDKRFEQIDKRFEQIDKRFEQIDKRLNFLENLMIVLIAGMIGSPFLVEYLARRRNQIERKKLDEAYKTVIVLRELAKVDPKVKKAMKTAGLE